MYFSLLLTPLKMAKKKAETCSRFSMCLYIVASNYSAVVGVYIVTCLTAWNLDIFKFLFQFVNTKLIFSTAYIQFTLIC